MQIMHENQKQEGNNQRDDRKRSPEDANHQGKSKVRLQQLSDFDICPILLKIEERCHLIWKEVSPGSFHLKTLWTPWNCLHVIVGVLHRTSKKKKI